jgi:hypothetical protein
MSNKLNNLQSFGTVGDKEIERTNALTLYRDSREYFEYYQRGKPNKSVDLSKVSYFLLMRSLELGLKAILKTKEGISTLSLRVTFGHDVAKIYFYCLDKKYIEPFDKEFETALKMAGGYYKEKDFEYTKIGYKELPSTSYLVDMIEKVYTTINTVFTDTKIQKFL